MNAGSYNSAFYDRAERSEWAARAIVSIIRSFLEIESVLDIGCARGTWLAAWAETGCSDFIGIDGPGVELDQLAINPAKFQRADLALPFDLGRRFDFAQCLEVAEHLPPARSRSLIADLVAHADVVLFSAAPPGQGGEFHINEQPYDFWKALFAEHGYLTVDCLRPRIRHFKAIPYWYRYNAILYVKLERAEKLSDRAREGLLAPESAIPDVAPMAFRLRKFLLRLLPGGIVDRLARIVTRITQGRSTQ